MWRIILSLWLCLVPIASLGQETEAANRDRDFLTSFLEDNLSGLGRTIQIIGFKGALSSRATFDEMTIADGDGIWLTIRNGSIGWNRSALFSGRVEISEMTAAEIILPRKPVSDRPTTQASGFSLPELPVGISIGILRADKVVLGEALFGAGAEVQLNGTMQLEGGEGSTELSVTRIDGRAGEVSFSGQYTNASRKAVLDLLVSEGKDGIAANMLDLPGRPSIELAIHGSGIIDNFVTDISLSTDGAPRLAGQVTLLAEENETGSVERSFAAALTGDLAPLLLPEYQSFLGPKVSLEAEGQRTPAGQLDLTRMVIGTKGFDLTGRLSVAPGGLPLGAALTIRMGYGDGSEVLLPIPGEKTFVRSGDLRLRYDAARGDSWAIDGDLAGVRRGIMAIGDISLNGSGRIARKGQNGVDANRVGGHLRFAATGLDPADPALASALGPDLRGRLVFHWQEGAPLSLPVFDVTGQGYGAKGGGSLSSLEDGLELKGRITAEIADMARFSGIAGRQLGGGAALDLSGSGGILSGLLDLDARIDGRDLSVDQIELDRVLQGLSTVSASIERDTEGLNIRSFDLTAATIKATGSGTLAVGKSDVSATLDFADLSALGPQYRGSMLADARLTESGNVRAITLTADASGLGIGDPTVDRLLSGPAQLSISAEEQNGKISLQNLDLSNPQISVNATGAIDGATRQVDVSARLNDMALLAPGFPGPLTTTGRISDTGDGYIVDLSGAGPGATNATVLGKINADFKAADLTIRGGGQSAILNPFLRPRNIEGPVSFDLTLNGPIGLSSLSGRASVDGGRFVAPTFGFELEAMQVIADLANGQAQLSGGANVRGGGRIDLSGPVQMTAPFNGDLKMALASVRLRDPDLYETSVTGNVGISGPFRGGALISGAVTLGKTEIRVPSTGFGDRPQLDGLTHINEPAPVQATRVRAGFAGSAGQGRERGPSYGMDLSISAPGRIFVRGRGLDAEMDGALRLTGTTDNIVPSGRFNLVRGRLDILGKRFTIDEGLVELQGALTPYIRFSAATESDGITATIVIEGEATAPEIRFLSSPELPEEEVIAQLLFGRSLTNLSAFQAAQLASAVATLAGKGGEGIVSKLRKSFGLDDLDVTTDTDGSAALKAGKYISEKLYTDVTIGADGKSEINLNLDVKRGLTVKGGLASDGSTGIGVYFERNY